jgi:hypothetical protein
MFNGQFKGKNGAKIKIKAYCYPSLKGPSYLEITPQIPGMMV